jgi:hypothetical protein
MKIACLSDLHGHLLEKTIFLNCSLVDEAYKPVNSIQIVELAS